MPKYTFTFEPSFERKFREVLGRLDETEYTVIEDIRPVLKNDDDDVRYANRQSIMEMDEEPALTFRLGMGNNIKIRRERTEEELAEEKALHDANTIKVTIKVDGLDTGGSKP